MSKEDILNEVWESLYGYKYILDRDNPRTTYIATVYEDIKKRINDNEDTKK